jgi:hypothetical protein
MTCTTERKATGRGPVDLAVMGRITPHRIFVANHDEDSVSMYVVGDAEDSLGDPLTISLNPGPFPIGSCMYCPRSIAVQATPVDSCNIYDLTVEYGSGGVDTLSWEAAGCEDCGGFRVWFTCRPLYALCEDQLDPMEMGLIGVEPVVGGVTPGDPLLPSTEPTWGPPQSGPWPGPSLPPLDFSCPDCDLGGPLGSNGDNGWEPLGLSAGTSYDNPGGDGYLYWITPREPSPPDP